MRVYAGEFLKLIFFLTVKGKKGGRKRGESGRNREERGEKGKKGEKMRYAWVCVWVRGCVR